MILKKILRLMSSSLFFTWGLAYANHDDFFVIFDFRFKESSATSWNYNIRKKSRNRNLHKARQESGEGNQNFRKKSEGLKTQGSLFTIFCVYCLEMIVLWWRLNCRYSSQFHWSYCNSNIFSVNKATVIDLHLYFWIWTKLQRPVW